MANTFKVETLNDNDIKSNSYEHLKVMLKNKIIQVVSAKSTVFNSKEEIRTYHTILTHLFATDEASDGSFYVQDANLQVYPAVKLHDTPFMAVESYHKLNPVLRALHRTCVIFNLVVDKKKQIFDNEDMMTLVPVQLPVEVQETPYESVTTLTLIRVNSMTKNELLTRYKNIYNTNNVTDPVTNRVMTNAKLKEMIMQKVNEAQTTQPVPPLTMPNQPTTATSPQNDLAATCHAAYQKLFTIWNIINQAMGDKMIRSILELANISYTKFFNHTKYPDYLKIKLIVLALGAKKFCEGIHDAHHIMNLAKTHKGLMHQTLEAFQDIKREYITYFEQIVATMPTEDTAREFHEDEIKRAFVGALLRNSDTGPVYEATKEVDADRRHWAYNSTSKHVTLDKLCLDIEHRLRHNLIVNGPKTTTILAAQPPLTAIPSVAKHCVFCHHLNKKGIKLYNTHTNLYDKPIPFTNHTIDTCTLKHCKHCGTSFSIEQDNFHLYNDCEQSPRKRQTLNHSNAQRAYPYPMYGPPTPSSYYPPPRGYARGPVPPRQAIQGQAQVSGNQPPRMPPRPLTYPSYPRPLTQQMYAPRPMYMAMPSEYHYMPVPPAMEYPSSTDPATMDHATMQQMQWQPSEYNQVVNYPFTQLQTPLLPTHTTIPQHSLLRLMYPCETLDTTNIPTTTSKLIIDSGAVECALNKKTSLQLQQGCKNATMIPRKIIVKGIGNNLQTIHQALKIENILHNMIEGCDGLLSVAKLTRQLNLRMLFEADKLTMSDRHNGKTIIEVPNINDVYAISCDQYQEILKRQNQHTSQNTDIYDSMDLKFMFIAQTFQRIVLNDKIKAFVVDLHESYGHPGTNRLIATILSNTAHRNIEFTKASELKNPFVLAAVIRKYYSRHRCIICLMCNKKAKIPRYNIISDIPDDNFETCYIDYKSMSYTDRYHFIGSHILVCKRSTYAFAVHVTNLEPQTTIAAVEQLLLRIKQYGYTVRTLHCDGTSSYTAAASHLVTIIPFSAASQHRNFVERHIQTIYLTYAKNYSAQYLLDHSFWSDGINTAISQFNVTVNDRTIDKTPHEMIFHTAPVTPGYKYGQPVIIMDNNEIQSSKGRGTPAVVIGLDNTNFYGAYVYRCGTYDGRPGRKLIALQDDMTQVDPKYDKKAILNMFHVPSILGPRRKRFDINLDDYINDQIPPPPPLHVTIIKTFNDQEDEIDDPIMYTLEMLNSMMDTSIMDALNLNNTATNSTLTTKITCEQYDDIKDKEPSIGAALKGPLADKWMAAIIEEIEKLQTYNIGTIITTKPTDQPIIPTKFALSIKRKWIDNQLTFFTRARLCARGDLQHEYEQMYSPTIRVTIIFILLALHIQYDYTICSFDVVGAFLQTPVTEEEIYISIKTPQSQQAVILKLNKYLYGLKSSNQKFFQYFSAILCEYGLEQVQDVEALFVNDDIILLLHVDDGFILDKSAGSTASKALLQHIQSKCELQVHTCVTDYLKLYFKYSQDIYGPYLLIHQQPTIEKMEIPVPSFSNLHQFMELDLTSILQTPLDSNYPTKRLLYIQSPFATRIISTPIQQITGKLVSLAYMTLPSIQLALHHISSNQNDSFEIDLYYAYQLYRYVKQNPTMGIIYRKSNNFGITVISDAAHMAHTDPMTLGHTAHMVCLGYCPIAIASRRATRPTLSAMETECHAHSSGIKQKMYIQHVLSQLKNFAKLDTKPQYITDSLSMIKLIARKKLYTDRIKHFINELSHIKHETNDGYLTHCISTHMVMDVLTKLNIPIKQQKYLTSMIYDVRSFLVMDQFLTNFDATNNDFDTMNDADINNFIYSIYINQPEHNDING